MAPSTARARTRCNGGFTFAEDPSRAAPEARILWHADLDPGVLHIEAFPAGVDEPDRVDVARLRPWLTIVVDQKGREHAVLSDGFRRIRLDPDRGSLADADLVSLHFHLSGIARARRPLLTLRRFLHLYQHCRFSASLYPADPHVDRGLLALRVHDALTDGASQRDIALALFGTARVAQDWGTGSDALRQHIVRLSAQARAMAQGGYRTVLLREARSNGSLPRQKPDRISDS